MKNPYKELGVERSATPEEIKAAYRRRAGKTHPDREGGNAEEFKSVAAAYKLLSSPTRRKAFDEGREDSAINNDRADMLQRLAELLLAAIDQCPEQVDILKAVRTHVEKDISTGYAKRREFEVRNAKLARALKRIKRRKKKEKGVNILAEMIKASTDGNITAMEKIDDAIVTMRLILATLDDYDFEMDDEAMETIFGKFIAMKP